MFTVENLMITHDKTQKNIIENFNLSLSPNDKLAFIGEEGTGKSSVIKAIFYRELDYAKISFDHLQHGFLAYVSQEAMLEQGFHFDGFTDYHLLYQYLDGFNLNESHLLRQGFKTLSGGERTKIAIIKALLKKPDVLVLDEPTNNLDIKSLLFLEKTLLEYEGILIFSSHDITFIQNVANKICHFESIKRRTQNQQTCYNMDYERFKSYRERMIEKEKRVYESAQKEIQTAKARFEKIHDRVEHAQNVISRQDPAGAKRLKVKMQEVKSVEKNIERKVERLETPGEYETPISFLLNAKAVHNQKVLLDMKNEPLMIEDVVLSQAVSLQIIGPEKIAIVGDNGVGKTTLIKKIMKALKIPYAYMPQSYHDVFDVDQTPLELLADTKVKEAITETMTYLGSLSFSAQEMNTAFKDISGGQKAKVFFARLALDEIELLILDEPTRNISSLSMAILHEEMINFKGAIVLITHDRMLLKNVVHTIYELTQESLIERTYSALYE